MSKQGEESIAKIRLDSNNAQRIAGLWKNYVKSSSDRSAQIAPKYCDMQYGIIKEKILDDLKKELDDFIEGFRIYLEQVVDKQTIEEIDLIKELEVDAIINFNYTNTEKRYANLKTTEIFHIHGEILKPDSMVLGIDDMDTLDIRFVYFMKYFQRIRKHADYTYRKWLDDTLKISVIGHSLDETDKDIIENFLDKAEEVDVYYYSQQDYEQKVINLIKIFGRKRIENEMYRGKYIFRKLSEC